MSPEAVLKQYEAALSRQQWSAVAPFIHDEAVMTFSEGTFRGKTAVRQAFEKTFALIKEEQYWLEQVQWLWRGEETAVCVYTFHWQGLIHGKPAAGSGRGTSVLQKTAVGWQILTEHLGPNPPSKEAT